MEAIRKRKWIMKVVVIIATLAMVATVILPYILQ